MPVTSFETHFTEVYRDRWPTLKSALMGEEKKLDRSCFLGHAVYSLDPASVIAANALGVEPGDTVLDMCAAPGGKALILLEALQGSGSLIVNEFSRDRRHRLERVMDEHAPEKFKSLIQVTGFDGNQFGLKRKNFFDKVLLDAPCSSERHLLSQDPLMKEWKVSRTKQLAMRQYSLLCSALLTLKPGGTLIYSTCSISPLENDGVIERILKKKSESIELVDVDLNFEKTKLGYQIFPDLHQGAGPIYFSKLMKK